MSSLNERTRRRKRIRRTSLVVERLEQRIPLAADLEITHAFLVDRHNNPISEPVEGERAYVRAQWRTTDLSSNQQYVVHYEMDGITVASNTLDTQAGSNLNFNWYRGVGYSAPGVRQVRVTVDGTNQISEANKSNNEFTFSFTPRKTDIPQKMLFPMGGVPFKDWSIVNYTDVDLNSGERADHRGGDFQYDGHDAFDITLPNFDRMEQGVPILAAAAGTVTTARDGNFDRETGSNSRPANLIAIDHGGGWVSRYHHLQRDTLAVEVGMQVTAGQPIALTGSSGSSTDAHLHFSLYRNGSAVEPMYAPGDYFAEPFDYQGNLPTTVLASGITDREPWDDFKELPNDIRVFRSDGGQRTWFWYRLSHVNEGEALAIQWYRPDGTLDGTYNWTAEGSVKRFSRHGWVRNTRTHVGRWTVVLRHEGDELARESFDVVASGGTPEIDVRSGSIYVIDGRSTPIDFGEVSLGAQAVQRSFSINNLGTQPLTISSVTVPSGFEIAGLPATTIAAGGSSTLRIRMTTDFPDHKWGDVVLQTNDSDESRFSFGIEGVVMGTANPSAPRLNSDTFALAIHGGLAVRAVFPELTIADSNDTDFGGARMVAKIVSGMEPSDRLTLKQFSPLSDLAIDGGELHYLGSPVANVVEDGSNDQLEIVFQPNTTNAVVTAVGRAIGFWDQASDPSSRRRIIEMKLVDPAGLISNATRRAAFYSDAAVNQPPTIEPIADQSMDQGSSLGPLAFAIADGNDSVANLNVTATSSNPGVLPSDQINVLFSNGTWRATISPPASIFGTTTISVEVADSSGAVDSMNFDLVVNSVAATPVLTNLVGSPTNHELIAVNVDFGKPVFGFTIPDLVIERGSAINLATANNQVFTFGVLPVEDGLITIDIPAGAATDSAGIGTFAASRLTITSDRTSPTPVIQSSQGSPTNSDAVSVTLDFGEAVLGFGVGDVGISRALLSGFESADAGVYTFSVLPTGDGDVTVSIPPESAVDAAGNQNTAANFSFVSDRTGPSLLSIERHEPGDRVTTSPTLVFRLTFDEQIENLGGNDFQLVGNGLISEIGEFNPHTFDLTVVPADDYEGIVGVKIIAQSDISDIAGNRILSQEPSIDETYESIAPALSLQVSPTSISENGGSSDVTVSRNTGVSGDQVVTIVSSGEKADAPDSVTIADGMDSVTFTVVGENNSIVDVDLSVTITASASGFKPASAMIDITDDDVPADPTTTWSQPEPVVFGTALSSLQLNATADVSGAFTYSPEIETMLDAGLGQLLNVSFVPDDTANYNTVTASVLLDVLKAIPTIHLSEPDDIVVGTLLGGNQLNATAEINGAFSYEPPQGTLLGAGSNQQLTATFTPEDVENYSIVMASVTINVVIANDFGDASEGYPVQLAENGARHRAGSLTLVLET